MGADTDHVTFCFPAGAEGSRPRHLFCGGGHKPPPLYIGFEQVEYRSNDHNTCLACRCDWTSYSVPLGLHGPSPFVPCALAHNGGSGGPCHRCASAGGPSPSTRRVT